MITDYWHPVGAGGSAGKKGPHKFTAEERVAAAWVHQTHLLSLLARGQMYDLAAADPLVQVHFEIQSMVFTAISRLAGAIERQNS